MRSFTAKRQFPLVAQWYWWSSTLLVLIPYSENAIVWPLGSLCMHIANETWLALSSISWSCSLVCSTPASGCCSTCPIGMWLHGLSLPNSSSGCMNNGMHVVRSFFFIYCCKSHVVILICMGDLFDWTCWYLLRIIYQCDWKLSCNTQSSSFDLHPNVPPGIHAIELWVIIQGLKGLKYENHWHSIWHAGVQIISHRAIWIPQWECQTDTSFWQHGCCYCQDDTLLNTSGQWMVLYTVINLIAPLWCLIEAEQWCSIGNNAATRKEGMRKGNCEVLPFNWHKPFRWSSRGEHPVRVSSMTKIQIRLILESWLKRIELHNSIYSIWEQLQFIWDIESWISSATCNSVGNYPAQLPYKVQLDSCSTTSRDENSMPNDSHHLPFSQRNSISRCPQVTWLSFRLGMLARGLLTWWEAPLGQIGV